MDRFSSNQEQNDQQPTDIVEYISLSEMPRFVIFVGLRAANFKRPLLAVDVSVCLCACLSATLMLNISETKRFRGFVSNREIESL